MIKMVDKKVDVTAVGTLAVDYFAVVPKIPGEEEKIMAEKYEVHPGGVAGNVLTQLARLGVKSGWIGKIGDDEAGRIVLNEFIKDGVDISHVEVVKDDYTMFTWIQVDSKGARAITMFPNVLVKLTSEDVERKHSGYIETSKILHAEICLLPIGPVLKAMKIAKNANVRIVLDLDVPVSYYVDKAKLGSREEVHEAIGIADVLIPCKSAARELIGSEDILAKGSKLLELGPEIVAITLGDKGCVVFKGEHSWVVPSFSINAVDTTGAGDAFHGGFIYGLLKGFDLEKAGRFANACGAYCCTGLGARYMGRYDDIKWLLNGA